MRLLILIKLPGALYRICNGLVFVNECFSEGSKTHFLSYFTIISKRCSYIFLRKFQASMFASDGENLTCAKPCPNSKRCWFRSVKRLYGEAKRECDRPARKAGSGTAAPATVTGKIT